MERLFGVRRADNSIASVPVSTADEERTNVQFTPAANRYRWNMTTRDWDADLLSEVSLTPDRFSECMEPTTSPAGLRQEYASHIALIGRTPAVTRAPIDASPKMLCKTTMGLGQSPSTLDKLVPKRRGLLEYPARRPFGSRRPITSFVWSFGVHDRSCAGHRRQEVRPIA